MQNIDEISEHDIIAWTFAHPGAMGCPGEITIITIHGCYVAIQLQLYTE